MGGGGGGGGSSGFHCTSLVFLVWYVRSLKYMPIFSFATSRMAPSKIWKVSSEDAGFSRRALVFRSHKSGAVTELVIMQCVSF